MGTQPEAVLEAKLIKQLVSLEYEKVSVVSEDELLSNLKNQLEKHNKISFSNDEFKRITNHLNKGTVFEKAKILRKKIKELKGEIGDLFLHMVFYCKIGAEKGAFDVTSVLHGICDKLVHRHPHIYGDVKATTEEEVKTNWEKLKLKEGKKSVLAGVPKSLPAVVKALRIQEKVKGIGFEWENKEDVWEKVNEEMTELMGNDFPAGFSKNNKRHSSNS